MEKQVKVWIARDEGYKIYETEHDYRDDEFGVKHDGDLHLFYDTPEFTGLIEGGPFIDENGETLYRERHHVFKLARECCSIPSYMFPEIKEGKCYLLKSDALEVDEVKEKIKELWEMK